MDAEQKLLPCPFCGGQPHIDTSGPRDKGWETWWLQCLACLADSSPRGDEESAIAAWNRRALQAKPAEGRAGESAWIRAWRNRFIQERMNAFKGDSYEVCRAKAEADANEFEEAFTAELEKKVAAPAPQQGEGENG